MGDPNRDDIVRVPDKFFPVLSKGDDKKDEKVVEKEAPIPNIKKEPENVKHYVQETINEFITSNEWFRKMGWRGNPFTFNIRPSLFVGYERQRNTLLQSLEEGHKLVFLLGPTGSGKTTMLKWLSKHMKNGFYTLYISKPPDEPGLFIDIFNEEFSPRNFLRFFRVFNPNIKNLYQVHNYLNKKFKGKKLVILLDEVHESDKKVLEWVRVLSDQVDKMSVVLSGLPIFEERLDNLETLRKRLAARIELLSLTKEDMVELIRKRIKDVGGAGNEFDNIMEDIFERTGGFPREVLRLCNTIVNSAIEKNMQLMQPNLLKHEVKKEFVGWNILENLTQMQKTILELLKRPRSPGEIADSLDLSKYKSRQHAVRSANNILKMMMNDGLVERVRENKMFIYSLAPKVRTLLVKA